MSDHNEFFDESSLARLQGLLDQTRHTTSRRLPPQVRKACMRLGIKCWRKEQKITVDVVELAWEKQVTGLTGLDGASDSEAEYLNTAKETLVRWLRENPDLGGGDPNQSSPVPRRPLPGAGSSSIALSPESETETLYVIGRINFEKWPGT